MRNQMIKNEAYSERLMKFDEEHVKNNKIMYN